MRLEGKTCPLCETEVTKDNYSMVALEKPYCNIFFHRDCLRKIEDLFCFLAENPEKWYNIGEKQ